MNKKQYQIQKRKLERRNEEILQKKQLKKIKNKYSTKITMPSTSKIILFLFIALSFQIIIFCQFIIIAYRDFSAIYALIGIPATLIPIIWQYYSKSKAENTEGGIIYDLAMLNKQQKDAEG